MDRDFVSIAAGTFTLEGRSRGGNETWFRLKELGLGFDIGRCPDELVHMPHVFVTHAHLDHAVGIPLYAGQRRLKRIAGGRVYVPAEVLSDFRDLMAIYQKLEETDYDIELVGVKAGDIVSISKTLEARVHQATHRVPANAFEVLSLRHHLRSEFANLSGEEIAVLRKSGAEVTEETRKSLFFYTGDTDRGILEQNTAIFKSQVLVIECTFVEDGDQVRAEKYRHIHFDDIAEFAGSFDNDLIVLTHFSLRYSREEIREAIRKRCPESIRSRIRIALGD